MSASSLLLLACVADPPAADDDGGEPRPDVPVALTDASNYRFEGTLDGPTLTFAEHSVATVTWADLTEDLQCHALDPVTDVDNVAILWFRDLAEADVEQGLADGTLQQVDLTVYLSYEPGDGTSASLEDVTFFGTDADIEAEFAEGSGAWLFLLTTGTTVGAGARMLAFLEPRADEVATERALNDGCAVLDYTVELTSLTPARIREEGPWEVDWSAVETNGVGQDFVTTDVSEVMLAWFADLSLAELEEDFLDLELLADRTWRGEHAGGTSADLAALVDDADGTPFAGFEGEGTWVLALRCDTCPNPAPLLLTVLEPG
ncbi:MAG: hypothetical protein ACOZNI_33515 [Myxococcota bacterium]